VTFIPSKKSKEKDSDKFKQESKKNDIKEESSTNNNTHKENYNINSDKNILINKNEELSKDKTDISNSKVSNNNIKNVEEKFYNGLIDEISEESFDLKKLKDAKLIQGRKNGTWIYYSLTDKGKKVARNVFKIN
jgi:hypothetical protein